MSSVVRAVTNVVNAVVNVVSAVVNAVVNVVSAVVNFVASPFMGLMGGLGDVPSGAAESQRQDGVLIQKQGSTTNIPVVYGYRQVAGTVIFAETGSSNNQYLWVAYVFSEGPVEGINEVWLDDNQLSTTVVQQLNNGQIVDVPDAKYSGRVRYQWFPGTYYTTPSDSTIGVNSICKDAPSWVNTMVYNGCAVLFARYQWLAITTQAQADANPFSGSIPAVKLSILGRKVASLRSTGFDGNNIPTGKVGSENYDYQGTGYTERYSTNPAEILLDYLRNPRYGKGLKNTDIDWDSFYTAAAKCNQNIPYSSVITGPCLTLNHVLDTNATLFSNTKALLQNFRGYLPYIQGKYKLKIEDAGNPTNILSGAATIYHTFDKDNIVGDIQYTAIDKSSKYNHVAVSWVDPDNKWSVQQTVFPADETTRQTYITQDGGRENNLEMIMSGITNSQIAQDMARLLFNKSRYQESCSFKASAEAMELEPGDNVYIRGNILTFGTTPWRIVSLKINSDYTCDIACVRNPDFIYPYVQANTPDYVAAPYIPTGATIKAPILGTTAPVGLYPPSRAGLPPGSTYPSTDGGVGGSTSTQNLIPLDPTQPAQLTALRDYVTINNATYTYNTAGDTVYVDISFRQPTNAQYSSLLVWYKPTSVLETIWKQVEITDRPGAGNTITYRLGPMIASSEFPTYDIRTRVKYATGEVSSIVDTSQLATGSGTAQNDPTDTQYIVGVGWTVPTVGIVGRRDDVFGVLKTINQQTQAQIQGGATSLPDVITYRQSLTGYPINKDIIGAKWYYRPIGTTYFEEYEEIFDATYVPGASYSKAFIQDWMRGNLTDGTDWDIIVRVKYNDNTYSSKQFRAMGMTSARRNNGAIGQDGFTYSPYAHASIFYENVTAYSFQTFNQGVQSAAVTDPRNTKMGIIGIYAVANITRAFLRLTTPTDTVTASYVRGVRVLFRPRGGDGIWTQYDTLGTTTANGEFVVSVDIPSYDTVYQYVVYPLVRDLTSTFSRVEPYYALFGEGYIHNRTASPDYPVGGAVQNDAGNWSPSFNWRSELLASAKSESLLPNPVTTSTSYVCVKSFNYIWQPISGQTGLWGETSSNLVSTGYYQVKLDTSHIGGLVNLHIFRRANYVTRIAPPTYFYGWGQWEHIIIPAATLTANNNIINLRPPLSYTMFNPWNGPTALPAFSTATNYLINQNQNIGSDTSYRFFVPYDDGQFEAKLLVENTNGVCKRGVTLRTKPTGYGTTSGNPGTDLGGLWIEYTQWPWMTEDIITQGWYGWKRSYIEAATNTPWNKLRYDTTNPPVVNGALSKPFISVTPTIGPAVI